MTRDEGLSWNRPSAAVIVIQRPEGVKHASPGQRPGFRGGRGRLASARFSPERAKPHPRRGCFALSGLGFAGAGLPETQGVALGWRVPAFQAEGTPSAARLLFYKAGRISRPLFRVFIGRPFARKLATLRTRQNVHNIPILHNVSLALLTQHSGRARFFHRLADARLRLAV